MLLVLLLLLLVLVLLLLLLLLLFLLKRLLQLVLFSAGSCLLIHVECGCLPVGVFHDLPCRTPTSSQNSLPNLQVEGCMQVGTAKQNQMHLLLLVRT